jgi:DNA-binding CsgD family transcriptional regulator
MTGVLQGEMLSMFEAKSREEVFTQVVRFAHRLEFQTISATVVIDRLSGEPEFIAVDNTPEAFLDTFIDMNKGRQDPVCQHCKKSNLPIVWDQSTYVRAGKGDMWEHQARFGYRHGIALALHLPAGRHLLVGIDRDQALPDDPSAVERMVSSLLMFSVHAQDALMRVLLPEALMSDRLQLTPRELETLRWTLEGKTAWEIGRILGIAENTAIRHAHSASRKLGCSSKHHAVVKALRLGLIQ